MVFGSVAFAQEYTDFNPSYIAPHNFMVDKVEYHRSYTVVFVRIVVKEDGPNFVISQPGGPNAWYLQGATPGSGELNLLSVRNVSLNSVPKVTNLTSPYEARSVRGTTYACELHFPPLPPTMTKANLVEGKGNGTKPGAYNAVSLAFRPKSSKERGKATDMIQRIKDFETKHRVTEYTNYELLGWNLTNEDEVETGKTASEPEKPYEPQLRFVVKVKFKDSGDGFQSYEPNNYYLRWISQKMIDHPQGFLKLEGHADINFTAEKAQALSLKRAEMVKQWFLLNHVASTRMETSGKGNSEPVVPRANGFNRRVEVEVWW